MHCSYFNKPQRPENKNNHSELRFYGAKIASRYFGTYSDFTWTSTQLCNPLAPSDIYYNNDNKYNIPIQEFLIYEPFLTKIYFVLRNPKDRMVSALAQSLFLDKKTNFTKAYDELEKITRGVSDIHLDRHHEFVYELITKKESSNNFLYPRYQKSFPGNELFKIEDIDETEYVSSFYLQKSDHDNSKFSCKPYITQVNEFIDYIKETKTNEYPTKWINTYLELETNYYNKLKLIK